MKPLKAKSNSSSGKKLTFLRLATSQSGKLYAEATADITIKKGERFFVNDPRTFLSEEELEELQSNGKLERTTASGKTYTLYDSLFAEVVKA